MNKIETYEFQAFPVNEKTKRNHNIANKGIEINIHIGDGWILLILLIST